jgi:hypothetical protein
MTHEELVSLKDYIKANFSFSELEELCFSVGIRPDDLRGDTVGVKALELVLYCSRRGLLETLEEKSGKRKP